MATLKRITRDIIPDFPSELLDEPALADEVHKKLSYYPLKREQESSKVLVEFQTTLNTLGIRPFDPKSVERYKASQVRWATWFGQWPWLAAIVTSLAVLTASILAFNNVFGNLRHPSAVGILPVVGIIMSVISGISLLFLVIARMMDGPKWRWSEISLRDFKSPIPVEALRLALRVKEHCPKAEICVSALIVAFAERARDPFLVVRMEGHDYYIAVWDEPSFSANLTA